jgi:hypothetical protein
MRTAGPAPLHPYGPGLLLPSCVQPGLLLFIRTAGACSSSCVQPGPAPLYAFGWASSSSSVRPGPAPPHAFGLASTSSSVRPGPAPLHAFGRGLLLFMRRPGPAPLSCVRLGLLLFIRTAGRRWLMARAGQADYSHHLILAAVAGQRLQQQQIAWLADLDGRAFPRRPVRQADGAVLARVLVE